MYRVHGDKVIRRRTNYRKENDIQKYTKILKEDFGNMCGYCGKDFNIIKCPYQKDHLIPEDIAKKVGRLDLLTDYNNLVYSCRVCNRNKWNNWPFDNVDKIHDDNIVNLYAFYVLEIALRIAVLEVIGVNVSDDVKNYVMDEHLDWIKLEKHLDEDCVLPMNVFRQMIEKLQNPT